ncbi:hypothetical protein AAMO2058_000308600 [Amorphochlora amoebiformis]
MHPNGHLFVLLGDVTKLSCDAWILPSLDGTSVPGGYPRCSSLLPTKPIKGWTEAKTLALRLPTASPVNQKGEKKDAVTSAPVTLSAPFPLPLNPCTPYVVNIGVSKLTPASERESKGEREEAEVEEGSEAQREGGKGEGEGGFVRGVLRFLREFKKGIEEKEGGYRASYRRVRPLVAIPLVEIQKGSQRPSNLLQALNDLTGEKLGFDLALVTANEKTYSLLQALRRRLERSGVGMWRALGEGLEEEKSNYLYNEAIRIAALANADNIVFFLGAGVSFGAGLPLWGSLISDLANKAGFSKQDKNALNKLDFLEGARWLRSRLGDKMGKLIAQALKSKTHSLQHALLAQIPASGVITTNYDELFEMACFSQNRPVRAIPAKKNFAPPKGSYDSDRWLLKLHGDVETPKSYVISRDDYVSYEDKRSALLSVVRTKLMTKHMVFVGFSLTDYNFYKIAHAVRSALQNPTKECETQCENFSDEKKEIEEVEKKTETSEKKTEKSEEKTEKSDKKTKHSGPALFRKPSDEKKKEIASSFNLVEEPAKDELWSDINLINIMPFPGPDKPLWKQFGPGARQLEIMLDFIGCFGNTTLERHLLNDSFQHVLTEDERDFGRFFKEMISNMPPEARKTDGYFSLIKFGESLGLKTKEHEQPFESSESMISKPKISGPKISEPKTSDPKASELKASELKAQEHKASEPKASENKASEPKASEPKSRKARTEGRRRRRESKADYADVEGDPNDLEQDDDKRNRRGNKKRRWARRSRSRGKKSGRRKWVPDMNVRQNLILHRLTSLEVKSRGLQGQESGDATKGHVFVVRADLRALACDGILFPSVVASKAIIGNYWCTKALTAEECMRVTNAGFFKFSHFIDCSDVFGGNSIYPGDKCLPAHLKDTGRSSVARVWEWPRHKGLAYVGLSNNMHLRGKKRATVRFIMATVQQYLANFNRDIHDKKFNQKGPLNNRKRFLAALPLIGMGAAGGYSHTQTILNSLLPCLQTAADKYGFDIALVCWDPVAYSMCQRLRMEGALTRFENVISREHYKEAERLALALQKGDLALVCTSPGYNLIPTLSTLLKDVASGGKVVEPVGDETKGRRSGFRAPLLSPSELEEFTSLKVCDQARVIESRCGGRKQFVAALEKAIKVRRKGHMVGLFYQMLAQLPFCEIVTDEVHTVLEDCFSMVERPLTRMRHSTAKTKQWILHLQGCATEGGELSITRADASIRKHHTLSSVVEALLITKQILYVGCSPTSELFQASQQAAGAIRGEASEGSSCPLGTLLTPVRNTLLEKDSGCNAHVICTATKDEPKGSAAGVRNLEIFLDLLGALIANCNLCLMDSRFKNGYDGPEEKFRLHMMEQVRRMTCLGDRAASRPFMTFSKFLIEEFGMAWGTVPRPIREFFRKGLSSNALEMLLVNTGRSRHSKRPHVRFNGPDSRPFKFGKSGILLKGSRGSRNGTEATRPRIPHGRHSHRQLPSSRS